MNYRELLKKYLNFVGEVEGTTFVSRLSSAYNFSLEEIEELYLLDKEAENDN